MKFNKLMAVAMIGTALAGTNAFAAAGDIVTGTVNLSGSVPEFFSMSVRGVPGDFELSPGATVVDRPIAVLHLKYNINISKLDILATTANGKPKLDGTGADYPNWATQTFKLACAASIDGGVTAATADIVADADHTLTIGSTGVADFLDLVGEGREEDCTLMSSWTTNTTQALPLAGVYSLPIKLTLTSKL